MTHHLINTGANAHRESFIVQTCRCCSIFLAVVTTDFINLQRGHTSMNSLTYCIQNACVHRACPANAFNLFGCFYQVACWHQGTFILKIHNTLVQLSGLLPWFAMPSSLHCLILFFGCKGTNKREECKKN